MHKKLLPIVVFASLALAGTAVAATHESHFIPKGAPSGYLTINPQTCRFLHPEIDVKPNALERYARAEDSRDDVKLSCLTRKVDGKPQTPPPDTCWSTPPPVTEAKPDKQGYHDETGAKALDAWAVALAACESARNAG